VRFGNDRRLSLRASHSLDEMGAVMKWMKRREFWLPVTRCLVYMAIFTTWRQFNRSPMTWTMFLCAVCVFVVVGVVVDVVWAEFWLWRDRENEFRKVEDALINMKMQAMQKEDEEAIRESRRQRLD
jgi:hypothetical protein